MAPSSGAPVTLVTGSARGIGRGVADHLRERGDRVHVVWRSEGEDAAALRDAYGDRAHRADLKDAPSAEAVVRNVVALDGRLDHLVHAVGEYVSGPLSETTADDLRRMFVSNVESAFHLFGAARPHLRAAAGRAVFFGSSGLSGLRARRRTAAYAAAKTALLVLVRGWALEEAAHGVTVNMVSPGHVPHAGAHADTRDPELLEQIPLGRPGQPEDLAHAVAFLCSPESSYTTGTDLFVTGGWML